MGGQQMSLAQTDTLQQAPPVSLSPSRLPDWVAQWVLPLIVAGVVLLIWQAAISWSRWRDPASSVLPSPFEVVLGIGELAAKGLLLKYSVSSLFRVTWAFLAAVIIGVPFGLVMGWF